MVAKNTSRTAEWNTVEVKGGGNMKESMTIHCYVREITRNIIIWIVNICDKPGIIDDLIRNSYSYDVGNMTFAERTEGEVQTRCDEAIENRIKEDDSSYKD